MSLRGGEERSNSFHRVADIVALQTLSNFVSNHFFISPSSPPSNLRTCELWRSCEPCTWTDTSKIAASTTPNNRSIDRKDWWKKKKPTFKVVSLLAKLEWTFASSFSFCFSFSLNLKCWSGNIISCSLRLAALVDYTLPITGVSVWRTFRFCKEDSLLVSRNLRRLLSSHTDTTITVSSIFSLDRLSFEGFFSFSYSAVGFNLKIHCHLRYIGEEEMEAEKEKGHFCWFSRLCLCGRMRLYSFFKQFLLTFSVVVVVPF